MTHRNAGAVKDTGAYAAFSPGVSPVAPVIFQENAIDMASEEEKC